MPKLKRTPEEQMLFEVRVAIENKANLKEVPIESLAKTAGRDVRTMYSRRKRPELYTLGELVKISQRLGGLGITL